jgi:hypothetical protein
MDVSQSGRGILDFSLPGCWVNYNSLWKRRWNKFFLLNKSVSPDGRVKRVHVSNRADEDLSAYLEQSNFFVGHFLSFQNADDFLKVQKLDLMKPYSHNFKRCESRFQGDEIAIHVRRGDYRQSNLWGLLSPDFYASAISILRKRTSEKIFVFSDEPALVKSELKNNSFFSAETSNDVMTFLGPGDLTPAETMLVFSRAKRLVLGNSSFSLWAGYLASDSQIVAPSQLHPIVQIDSENVFNPNWKSITPIWVA